MPDSSIPFRNTNYFSDLICDYLNESPELNDFYGLYPTVENFKRQLENKSENYNHQFRPILYKSLVQQYKEFSLSEATEENLELLKEDNTFTVVTGHQLNLFTGPLYFFYKIVSTINLCKQLSQKYRGFNFVPVYWMATEDHDFEEINFFNFGGKKIQWNREASGVVGNLELEGLKEVYEVFSKELNASSNADALRELFQEAYLNHSNLAAAMRFLVNEIFKNYGLVIVDGDDRDLKELFKPYMRRDLLENLSFNEVEATNKRINALESNYNIQVNPREINLFYIHNQIRERIVQLDGDFYVNDTDIKWTKDQLLKELDQYPQRFSPNVIMRPIYQEVILPNLCYIGGGGELAYWLQLKTSFEKFELAFPILLLRNSALLINEQQLEKLNKLQTDVKSLFKSPSALRTSITKKVSEIDIDFSTQKQHLEHQFKTLYDLAKKTDPSFIGAVAAQEKKQKNGLDHLEKRLLKAQKRKLADYLDRVTILQSQLFPNGSLQERKNNFSEFYLEKGDAFIDLLIKNLDPFNSEFLIIKL